MNFDHYHPENINSDIVGNLVTWSADNNYPCHRTF